MRIGIMKCRIVLAVALAMVWTTSVVSAATVTLALQSGLSTTGGPFTATVQTGSVGKYTSVAGHNQFSTFCVEVNEEFSPGSTYYAVTSDRSVKGTGSVLDQNGTNGYVKLQATVAYLYSNYVAGNAAMTAVLASVGSSHIWTGSAADQQSLQNAIWYFMGYQNYAGVGGALTVANGALANGWGGYTSSYVNGSIAWTKLLEDAAVNAGWVNTGNVAVMQMWSNYNSTTHAYSGIAQDQLVMLVPTPTASLAGMILLGGLCVVGYMRRYRLSAGFDQ